MDILGVDKLLHFVFSYTIALIDPALAVLAGLGKEALDVLRGGIADPYDLAADALGILTAL